jgi:hypothetical protein
MDRLIYLWLVLLLFNYTPDLAFFWCFAWTLMHWFRGDEEE